MSIVYFFFYPLAVESKVWLIQGLVKRGVVNMKLVNPRLINPRLLNPYFTADVLGPLTPNTPFLENS